MRICFLSSMHPPADKRVFEKEARSLADAGYEVIHLAPDHDEGKARVWQQDGVRLVVYPPMPGLKGRFFGLFSLYRMARLLDADVYHCNEVDSWIVGVWLRLFACRICVFDAHEHYPEEFAEKRIPSWARPLVRGSLSGFMRVLSWFTQRVVVAKRSLLGDFQHMPTENVLAVQNFVSVKALPKFEVHQVNADGPLKLVHLGLFNRYRGWPQLLEALVLADSADIELLVVGTINDGSEDAFKHRIDELGLSGRVDYQTWLPLNQAMELVKHADIGVICFQPGLYNHVHALPHKMFDYMGAGLAVMAPNIAVEVCDIVTESDCGVLIDASDPRSIAAELDRLCASRETVRAMGRRGRAAVLDRYNWEIEAEVLLEMYRTLRV